MDGLVIAEGNDLSDDILKKCLKGIELKGLFAVVV